MSTIFTVASIIAVFLLVALSVAGFLGARHQRRRMPWADNQPSGPDRLSRD